jgi:hypothetical protein
MAEPTEHDREMAPASEQAPDPWDGFPDRIRGALITALAAAREEGRREASVLPKERARRAEARAVPPPGYRNASEDEPERDGDAGHV